MNSLNSVPEFTTVALKPGYLGELFHQGLKAAILVEDSRVQVLSDWCLSKHGTTFEESAPETMPWEARLTDIAKNYWAHGCGDNWHYADRQIAYISRKVQFFKDDKSEEIICYPPYFFSKDRIFVIPDEIAFLIWNLAEDIHMSLYSCPLRPQQHVVSFERLKYDDCLETVQKNLAAVRESLHFTRWAKLGYEIDSTRELFRGWLSMRYLRDVLAFLCLNGKIQKIVLKVNEMMSNGPANDTLNMTDQIIGQEHVDKRYFTCLLSWRESYTTEYFDGTAWQELPIAEKKLTIIPGELSQSESGIRATKHRVVMRRETKRAGSKAPNITVLIGVKHRRDSAFPVVG